MKRKRHGWIEEKDVRKGEITKNGKNGGLSYVVEIKTKNRFFSSSLSPIHLALNIPGFRLRHYEAVFFSHDLCIEIYNFHITFIFYISSLFKSIWKQGEKQSWIHVLLSGAHDVYFKTAAIINCYDFFLNF